MNSNPIVYTPLRVTLMVTILIFNLMALIAYLLPQQSWSDFVIILSVVFIMMLVFVILLEITWLHHMGKTQENSVIKAKYNQAKLFYAILFIMGFGISYWVLIR